MSQPRFLVGDPAPDFYCATTKNSNFYFGSVAGRYIVLTFFGSAAIEKSAQALAFITTTLRPHFDDQKAVFFGISIDPEDRGQARVSDMFPGVRIFWDFDRKISALYGAIPEDSDASTPNVTYHPFTLVLDPNLRVVGNIPLVDVEKHNQLLHYLLEHLPAIDDYAGVPLTAPVLVIPRVFEPEFCRKLISLYDEHGGYESGSMIDKDGKTVGKIDYSHKRRMDYDITDSTIQEAMRQRIRRRIIPEIHKAFQFHVTRIERYIVACYDGEHKGFFRPHRDNNTKGTAHRKFACSINLNTEEYEGGDLRFPEFGSRLYRAPTGGAVVFSCSLLHEAMPVTKGKRYATLPFFYDEEAAQLRRENLSALTGEVINVNEISNRA